MTLLFLTQQKISEGAILKGGETASKANYNALKATFGSKNIKVINIPEEKCVWKRYIHYLGLRNMYSRKNERKIIREINHEIYDYIFFDGTWFGKISNMINADSKIIVFLHNVEKQYSLDRVRKNPLTFLKLFSVLYNEKKIIKSADYIFVLNERDRKLVQRYYDRNCDVILPITLQDKYKIAPNLEKNNRKTILFVGSYFKPNVEGIVWFIRTVMPYVDCHLVIVGKDMEKLRKYENRKVTVKGTVDDIGKEYQSAHAVVIPIFSGGGMKVKTAEALMYGKAILASDEALMGYEIDGFDRIERCNCATEYIEAIEGLSIEETFHQEIRDLFLQKYEQKMKNEKIKDFFTKIDKV